MALAVRSRRSAEVLRRAIFFWTDWLCFSASISSFDLAGFSGVFCFVACFVVGGDSLAISLMACSISVRRFSGNIQPLALRFHMPRKAFSLSLWAIVSPFTTKAFSLIDSM